MSKISTNKKTYQKPTLKPFGSVKDLTKTSSAGGNTDGGSVPFDRMGTGGGGGGGGGGAMCVSTPPIVTEHKNLVADEFSQLAFKNQIEKHVRPGDVVVDLGTGSGLHTLFALKAGAKKVYAIESGLAIYAAREVIAVNGYSDKVTFVHEDSRSATLPEKADVLISNIGFLLSVKCLPQAARDFLKPGGKLIPSGAQIAIVPYMDKQFYSENMAFWSKPHYGFDLSPMRRLATHHPHYLTMQTEGILAEPALARPMDFSKETTEPVTFNGTFKIDHTGEMHGLAGWYTYDVMGTPLFSTRPPMKLNREVWSNFFLPLERSLKVVKGEEIKYSVAIDFASLVDTALWFWTIETAAKETLKHSSVFALSEPNLNI